MDGFACGLDSGHDKLKAVTVWAERGLKVGCGGRNSKSKAEQAKQCPRGQHHFFSGIAMAKHDHGLVF